MNITTFNAPIIVSKLEAHKEIKESVIRAIDGMGRFSHTLNSSQRITHTDWHLGQMFNRPYWPIVEPHLMKSMSAVGARLDYGSPKIDNYWFQWYANGDFHIEHVHAGAMFSNVYYLQLSGDNPKTSFILNKQRFEIPVSEGDVITFPSFLIHESPPNEGQKPKVVIAFNTNYWSKHDG